MSISCRYYTNGKKAAYILIHTDTGIVEEYSKIEGIPKAVRNYFARLTEPKFIGPDLSHIMGLNSVFYPDWSKRCTYQLSAGRRCIAESCRYANTIIGGWENCPCLERVKNDGRE